VDHDKLLNGPKQPTTENLLYPQVGRLDLGPDAGAHAAFPVLGMELERAAKGGQQRQRDRRLQVPVSRMPLRFSGVRDDAAGLPNEPAAQGVRTRPSALRSSA
jgi:hypothetical protein